MKLEYIDFDENCFHYKSVKACKIRYTDDHGRKTIIEDSDVKKNVEKAVKEYNETNEMKIPYPSYIPLMVGFWLDEKWLGDY